MEKTSDISLLPIILALIAAIPGILSLRNQMVRGKVENAVDLVDTAMKLKAEMEAELDVLRGEVRDLEQRQRKAEEQAAKCAALVRVLIRECSALIHQLHSLNAVPVFTFEDLEALVQDRYPELDVGEVTLDE